MRRAAAGPERRQRPDRAARARRERRALPVSRPLLLPLPRGSRPRSAPGVLGRGAGVRGSPGDAPLRLPEVVWRAASTSRRSTRAIPPTGGSSPTLVWPGEHGRAARIEAALDIVAADPPVMIAGDASDPEVLRRAAAQAPAGATLVVTTPGVLPHIARAGRERLIATHRARSTPSGSRSTRRGCTTAGVRPSMRHLGRVRARSRRGSARRRRPTRRFRGVARGASAAAR